MTRQPSPYSDTARLDPLDHRLARVAPLPPADLATLRDARRILSVAARFAADEASAAAGTPADARFAADEASAAAGTPADARFAADEASAAAGTPADARFAADLSAAVTTILTLEHLRTPRMP